MSDRVQIGKGDKNRTINKKTFRTNYDKIKFGTVDCSVKRRTVPPPSSVINCPNISVFKTYSSIHINNRNETIRGNRQENLLLDRFKKVRHEDLKGMTFSDSKPYELGQNKKVKTEYGNNSKYIDFRIRKAKSGGTKNGRKSIT